MRQKIISLNTPIARNRYESAYPWQWDGLVGSWAMIEGGGLAAFDWSGSNHTGTLTSGPSWTPGQAGTNLTFGPSSYVNVPSSSVLDSLVGAQTLMAWVRMTSDTADFTSIMYKGSAGEIELDADARSTTDVWRAVFYDGSSYKKALSNEKFTLNKWTHVCGTLSPGRVVNLFIDGVKQASTETLVGPVVSHDNDPLTIGSWGTSRYFNGQIDDSRWYNKRLSDNDITTIYRLGPKSHLIRRRRSRYAISAAASHWYRQQRAMLIGGGLR